MPSSLTLRTIRPNLRCPTAKVGAGFCGHREIFFKSLAMSEIRGVFSKIGAHFIRRECALEWIMSDQALDKVTT
jgi:hypothetical protein